MNAHFTLGLCLALLPLAYSWSAPPNVVVEAPLIEAYTVTGNRVVVLHSQISRPPDPGIRMGRTTRVDYYLSSATIGEELGTPRLIGSLTDARKTALASDGRRLFLASSLENQTNLIRIGTYNLSTLEMESSAEFRLEKLASPRRILMKPAEGQLFIAVESYESNDDNIRSGLYLGRLGGTGTLVVENMAKHIPIGPDDADGPAEPVLGPPPAKADIAQLIAGLNAVSSSKISGRELIADLSVSAMPGGAYELELVSYIPHPTHSKLSLRSFRMAHSIRELGSRIERPLPTPDILHVLEPHYGANDKLVDGEDELQELPAEWCQTPVGKLNYRNTQVRYGGKLRLSAFPAGTANQVWIGRNLFDRGLSLALYRDGLPIEMANYLPPDMKVVDGCSGEIAELQ